MSTDKRKLMSEQRAANLAKAREARALSQKKKKEEAAKAAEDEAKQDILQDLDKKEESPAPQPEVEPLVEVNIEAPPVKEKKSPRKEVPDDFDDRIYRIVEKAVKAKETEEQRRQRELEQMYEFLMTKNNPKKEPVSPTPMSTPQPQQRKLSLFDY